MEHKTIYLVRHGITHSNKKNIYSGWCEEELIEEGIAQANKLGKEMQGWGISSIFTSPIKRAVQTAQILNRYIKGRLIIEPYLKEMKMGAWEGLSEHEVAKQYPSEHKMWLERPAQLRISGRETLKEVQQRAVKAINRILEMRSDKIRLAVTHVAIIRCIFLYFNKLPLNLYKEIDVPNLSIYQLVLDNGKIRIKKSLKQ